jgi:hypothetical protein
MYLIASLILLGGTLTRNNHYYTPKKSFEIIALIAVGQISNLACN